MRTPLILAMLFLILGRPAAFAQELSPVAGDLVLVGATIYVSPTEEPIRDGVVLIHRDKIVAVGPRASVGVPRDIETIDCTGRTIVPGFWNSHVHFFERKWTNAPALPTRELDRQLQDMFTRYGFTSVFDLSSVWENTRAIRDRIESGEVGGPRIRTTGEALVSVGAVPPDLVISMMGLMKTPLPEVADATQAVAATKKLLEQGVDGIKVMMKSGSAGGASFPEGALEAVVAEAHRAGKPVFVHPSLGADVQAALQAGVDVIAHTTPYSGPWNDSLLAMIRNRRVALIPTLTLWEYYSRHDRASSQDKVVESSTGQLRDWIAAGGTVLFGTDVGAVEYDPSEEYALMAKAGMSFGQILASLTTTPAERFGDGERLGKIAPGFQADLVVLKGDPAQNVRALTAVQLTLRAGKVIYRAAE